ncbi:MAG: D-aminoacyl-tRNA deacylase [Burkholderiales bacterium]|jgi:D-tyrosyl-tRNA(Tyr) deacylase|nr:D-tyrosyl-tRNA(Tyr) deacylase [Burkholderiales bacterium]MCA3162119.1 D-tyrosyl-tRNA(Tyr) deacylase [Burkholderiales bacterium]MCA3163808.1 D-tyrosyl-tRNA(Tyr) deacylase [Burkholderiales bacterium]MCA3165666.1 D-tyrosyl-tRNA(Tyr) deacylase [Burkholderiales bacterium]MCA3169898.1 D-tyrosyl-tRNA(Tyr) deacylase [Burkholderiales bacterium]
MIALLQRVSEASVRANGQIVGSINAGLLVFLCAERGDRQEHALALLNKLLNYRVFSDEVGKMNRSLLDTGLSLLLVPQFTLAADTRSGTRPSFSPAAAPQDALKLFNDFVNLTRSKYSTSLASIETGIFGADMKVSLINDGPVTFWLQHPVRGANS